MPDEAKNLRRSLLKTRRKAEPGAPPGTLASHPEAHPTKVCLMAFNLEEVVEQEITKVDQIKDFLKKWDNVWVQVSGLSDIDTINEIGSLFSLHPLALEDAVNVHQRPKVDDYENHLFITARRVVKNGGEKIDLEQVSLFFGEGYVLSFQESSKDGFEAVRERIRRGSGRRIRLSKPDYLTYALLDAMVDGYFPLLEDYSDRLDHIEDDVLLEPNSQMVSRIHNIKRDLLLIRRATWPQRDALNTLSKESNRVSDDTRIYLRDCHDHITQVLDILESLRERSTGLTDIYLSSLSNKMNEVMKVLTIIATIFMPLGFIAGIYGMNFDPGKSPFNMPELSWYFGYPFAILLMGVIAVILLIYFNRKGWLSTAQKIKNKDPQA
ncbi:MAG: magnesium transport protein CorA [Nitrospinaceae bacterium]|nr:MAG: magnesium transport protein CorA [Nitrospinaceae bacterium]